MEIFKRPILDFFMEIFYLFSIKKIKSQYFIMT